MLGQSARALMGFTSFLLACDVFPQLQLSLSLSHRAVWVVERSSVEGNFS